MIRCGVQVGDPEQLCIDGQKVLTGGSFGGALGFPIFGDHVVCPAKPNWKEWNAIGKELTGSSRGHGVKPDNDGTEGNDDLHKLQSVDMSFALGALVELEFGFGFRAPLDVPPEFETVTEASTTMFC